VLRGIFVAVATPAALVAIASGTAIFLLQGPLVPWLMVKLALVGMLVLGHAACGLLVLRTEREDSARVELPALVLGTASLLWLSAIAWLVLRKPML
jgi:putative membrane protein